MVKSSYKNLDYFHTAAIPRIFIASGLHGDEWGVIASLEKAVLRHERELPPFLFVPRLCPSAVEARTRCNRDGVDINRNFFDFTTIPEVQAVQRLFDQFHFAIGFSFHEDLCTDCFYMYDSGPGIKKSARRRFVAELRKVGVRLFDGIDDPDDAVLGYRVRRGFVKTPPGRLEREQGTFERWAITTVIADCVLTPEIPGKVSQEVKDKIVDAFFRCVILSEAW